MNIENRFEIIKQRAEKRSGVTLLEILLVVALIAVFAAVGAPVVFHNLNQSADTYMLDGLMAELEYARSMGLLDFKDYAVFKTTADSPVFECATRTRNLDGGVVFAENNTLYFNNLGRLVDASGNAETAKSLSLKAGTRVVGTLLVSPQGLIKRQ